MSFPLESILGVVGSGLKIYSDKIAKEWPNDFEKYKKVLLEQKSLNPINRDMRKYDDALKNIYFLHKKVSILMQQEAVKRGLL